MAPHSSSSLPMSHSNSERLYLRGLRKDVTEQELFKFLSCYGRITEVKLLTNYAFVQFESKMDALIVLETYQRQPLLGKNVVVEYSHPLRKDRRPFSDSITDHQDFHRRYPVIVIDIPPDVCWQNLKDFGRSSGQMVAFCDLDRTQKGHGFIEYFTKEDAKTAARVLDGRYLGGKPVRVVEHETTRSRSPGRLQHLSRSRTPEYGGPFGRYTRYQNIGHTETNLGRFPEEQSHASGRWKPQCSPTRISYGRYSDIYSRGNTELSFERLPYQTSKRSFHSEQSPNTYYNDRRDSAHR